jgi:putative endopeptidase
MNCGNWKWMAVVVAGAMLAPLAVRAQDAGPKAPERLTGFETAFLDKGADPCVDFEKFACGNFNKLHPIPADRGGFGSGAMLYDYNVYLLHTILEKAAAGGAGRSGNEQKIGDFYAACMDQKAIDARGLAGLKPELDRIAALTSKSELPALLAQFQLNGVNAFLNFGEQQDFHDARKQIAVVDQGGLGLPERDYYLREGDADKKIREQYVEHVAKMLALEGESAEQSKADAQKIMALETALAKNSLDITSQRDPNKVYHLMPVSGLEKLAPDFGWQTFLKDSGAPSVSEINVTYPEFFSGLNSLLAATDMATIQAYLRWQLIAATPGLVMPAAIDDEDFNFSGKILSGRKQQQPRWKRCVQATDNALGEALGQVYVKTEFPPASKAATLQMVHDIEAAMDQDIDQIDWMSAETKVRAKAKLTAIANKIGYPDRWRDYSTLKVERTDALGNFERATEFEARRQLNKIGQPVDKGEFGMSPPTVDAYYNPSMNDINFPAGILQPPFYDASQPDAVNYGHVGAIVGHELTHGFDDQGRQFGPHGDLADWWTAGDAKNFEQKADCEVKEYGNFVVDGDVHVNGKLTLGENTADNGGIRLAYMAFLADAKRKSIDLQTKHDGYTPRQQFFIAYAQNWCGDTRPQAERMQVQTDPHSPRQFRVNGVVQNMPELGEAFGCKVGQPMMPVNGCRVW